MTRALFLALLCFASATSAVEITQVRANAVSFLPESGDLLYIHFSIDTPAEVTLRLYDGMNRHVRSVGPKAFEAGAQSIAWDGRDDGGGRVPAEAFVYTLEAVDRDGHRTVHDLTDITGSQPIVATDIRWDAATKQILYRLESAARANIRVGLKNNGPLLRTIIDWVPRSAGEHAESWDGWDASHVLNLEAHPGLSIAVDAYTLSRNTVLVGPPSNQVVLPDRAGGTAEPRSRGDAPRKRMHYHAQQPLEDRGDVLIELSVVGATRSTEDGHTTVSGLVPVRLDVSGKDRQRILRTRFEPVFFVDGTFVFENEVGFLPTTWIWDTRLVNDGWHYINANVRGYEGNFGMATIKLKVDNSASEGAQ